MLLYLINKKNFKSLDFNAIYGYEEVSNSILRFYSKTEKTFLRSLHEGQNLLIHVERPYMKEASKRNYYIFFRMDEQNPNKYFLYINKEFDIAKPITSEYKSYTLMEIKDLFEETYKEIYE